MDFNFFAVLFGIVLIGAFTSYTDYKYGKIFNKFLLFGVSYFFVLLFAMGVNHIDWQFLGVNLLLTLIISISFWVFGLWTAGDGKLYIVFSSLLSLVGPPESFVMYPFFLVLVFAFVPYFIYLSAHIFYKTGFGGIIKKVFENLTIKKAVAGISLSFLNLVAIQWVFEFLPEWEPLILLRFPLIMLVYFLLHTYLRMDKFPVIALVGLSRFFLDESIYEVGFFVSIISMLLLIFFIRKIIPELGFSIFTEEKKISELKEGDIPAEVIYVRDKGMGFEKREIPFFVFSLMGLQKGKFLFNHSPTGINRKDISEIKRMSKDPYFGYKYIKIYKCQGFAYYLFLGSALTFAIIY